MACAPCTCASGDDQSTSGGPADFSTQGQTPCRPPHLPKNNYGGVIVSPQLPSERGTWPLWVGVLFPAGERLLGSSRHVAAAWGHSLWVASCPCKQRSVLPTVRGTRYLVCRAASFSNDQRKLKLSFLQPSEEPGSAIWSALQQSWHRPPSSSDNKRKLSASFLLRSEGPAVPGMLQSPTASWCSKQCPSTRVGVGIALSPPSSPVPGFFAPFALPSGLLEHSSHRLWRLQVGLTLAQHGSRGLILSQIWRYKIWW